MDNARFHRGSKLSGIARASKARLIFLPPYSPDLNPIEKVWANMKRWLIDNASRFDRLEDAIYDFL